MLRGCAFIRVGSTRGVFSEAGVLTAAAACLPAVPGVSTFVRHLELDGGFEGYQAADVPQLFETLRWLSIRKSLDHFLKSTALEFPNLATSAANLGYMVSRHSSAPTAIQSTVVFTGFLCPVNKTSLRMVSPLRGLWMLRRT